MIKLLDGVNFYLSQKINKGNMHFETKNILFTFYIEFVPRGMLNKLSKSINTLKL